MTGNLAQIIFTLQEENSTTAFIPHLVAHRTRITRGLCDSIYTYTNQSCCNNCFDCPLYDIKTYIFRQYVKKQFGVASAIYLNYEAELSKYCKHIK